MRFTGTGINLLGNGLQEVGSLGITFSGSGAAVTRSNLSAAQSGTNADIVKFTGAATANASPAYSFSGQTTSGIGGFGADVQIVRSGGVVARTSGSGLEVDTVLLGNNGIRVKGGSVGDPSFGFTGDTTSGMYRPAVGQVGLTVTGTNILNLTATSATVNGSLVITGSLTLSGTAAAPSNTTTPVAWSNVVISGTTYKIPLYQ
jgi:hypothetical protein